ncbi:hydrolase [Actinobacteria bacterium YIM 96077]|uniref:Hydrolase n=1 Tax=Phytoactinopolyspora halophila TaxID=1981511 RepID=A0A329R2D5_9ACTN|nr:zinc-dependent metalloprotease [Phytoactinopolyspora halophila]AYY11961.1 hydrolase [Actinobacteria bacterium YIM 96077]RAW18805.1 hydrolase [Phytoactinopolyspora halophila]
MSDVPFGFRPDDDDDDQPKNESGSGSGPNDPLSSLFGMMGASGQQGSPDLGQMLQQIGKLLSWSGGPVNWDLANSAARDVVSSSGDRSVSSSERRDVEDAFRLADTWLDDATSFPSTGGSPRAWSRAEWVEGTQNAWKELIEPVAARVSDAMSQSLPPEMSQAAGPLVGMLQQVGVSMWGAQVGQSIGTLASEVCGASDIGIPLAEGHPALLPANVQAFGEGLGIDGRDVMLYLALREAAYVRLYAHAPWLRSHIISLVEEYARHVNVDTDSIESKLRDIDPSRPEALQEALEGGLFELPTTPQQQAALDRLELALALVEGWVDDVVTQATKDRLPSAEALRETIRRRRATGGPAEQTFATLVGLQLRPRRLRDAVAFWAAIREERDVQGRDAVWAHPDLMPSADDLADPQAFLHRDELVDVSDLERALGSNDEADEARSDGQDGPDDTDEGEAGGNTSS